MIKKIKKLTIQKSILLKLSIFMILGMQVLSAGTSVALTDREWRILIIEYMVRTASRVLPGYTATKDENGNYNIDTDRLLEGQSHTYDISLSSSNRRLAFLAVCDQYCSDIDLRAYKNGRLLAEDISPDDNPVINIERGTEGMFQIRVTMVECSTSGACYYGVGLLKK